MSNTVLIDDVEYMPVISVDNNGNIVRNRRGDTAANVVAEIQQGAGVLETRDITLDGVADLFTAPSAPIAAELITITPVVLGKKRCRISWHTQANPYVNNATSDIPFAAFCVATINAEDDDNALSRLALANNGVGAHNTDTRKRFISPKMAVIEWDLSSTDSSITRVDIGGIPPADTGKIPVYLSVEIW